MRVAIIGASNKPERYSYQALGLLIEKGHEVYPVNPVISEIDGVPVYPNLQSITDDIDTMTMYVNESVSNKMRDEILAAQPNRIIFNPGAENPLLEKMAVELGIEVINGCTLVMLRTKQF